MVSLSHNLEVVVHNTEVVHAEIIFELLEQGIDLSVSEGVLDFFDILVELPELRGFESLFLRFTELADSSKSKRVLVVKVKDHFPN